MLQLCTLHEQHERLDIPSNTHSRAAVLRVQIHAHGQAMAALRLNEKWLLREGKALIRNRVIKTRFGGGDFGGGDGGDGATPESTPAPEVCACSCFDNLHRQLGGFVKHG
jgi:hypothetical protein